MSHAPPPRIRRRGSRVRRLGGDILRPGRPPRRRAKLARRPRPRRGARVASRDANGRGGAGRRRCLEGRCREESPRDRPRPPAAPAVPTREDGGGGIAARARSRGSPASDNARAGALASGTRRGGRRDPARGEAPAAARGLGRGESRDRHSRGSGIHGILLSARRRDAEARPFRAGRPAARDPADPGPGAPTGRSGRDAGAGPPRPRRVAADRARRATAVLAGLDSPYSPPASAPARPGSDRPVAPPPTPGGHLRTARRPPCISAGGCANLPARAGPSPRPTRRTEGEAMAGPLWPTCEAVPAGPPAHAAVGRPERRVGRGGRRGAAPGANGAP